VLLYGTAGVGLVDSSGRFGGTDSAFVWGLGVEGKINPTMSARLEYLQYDTDNTQAHADTIGVIRAGLNIKLGPWVDNILK
jgi:opacity protein-like surface antigen